MGTWNVGRTLEKFCVLSTFHVGHYANKPVESAAYYWNNEFYLESAEVSFIFNSPLNSNGFRRVKQAWCPLTVSEYIQLFN